MNTMVSMNVNVEVGGSAKLTPRFAMVVRLVQQNKVKHHIEIHEKWLDIITLKVRAASAKNSNNVISIFKVAPAPDSHVVKTGQTLCSGDQMPESQYGQTETSQEHKNVLTVQQLNGEISIKMLNDAIGLAISTAILFYNAFMNHEITALDMVVVILILVAILRHQPMNGTNRAEDNLQITPNILRYLFVIGALCISGANAQEISDNVCSTTESPNAVAVGNVLEEGENLKVAALILTVIVVGGASLWMLKRPATIGVDRCLERAPVPTKSNPEFTIHRKLEHFEEALLN